MIVRARRSPDPPSLRDASHAGGRMAFRYGAC
jgi:hypothetical protein